MAIESFRWGAQFRTGIESVDEQHHTLVKMLNQYGSALAENVLDKGLLNRTLEALAVYARKHFETEQKMMISSPLDQRHIRRHIKEHVAFVDDITMLAEAARSESHEDYRTLLDFLIHWLAYHILGIDQVMARQISAVRDGVSPEAAFLAEEQQHDSSNEPLVNALSGLFALVSKRNKALTELNRTLESRVAERTEELVEANRELEIISVTDHLTGLPNRRFAMRQMQLFVYEAVQRGQPLACLMIDADGFKEVNDTYGHDAGDIVLQRLARELQHSVRSDDIVCRLGGDEFMVICPNTALPGAIHLGEQVRENVAGLYVDVGSGGWSGSVSVGVAVSVPGEENVDSLLKAADEAVYMAKKDGRNCVRYTKS